MMKIITRNKFVGSFCPRKILTKFLTELRTEKVLDAHSDGKLAITEGKKQAKESPQPQATEL